MNKFQRKIYSQLLQWKKESNGRTALLIEGAPGVGKTTIVREFAEAEYRSYLLIDFSKPSKEVEMLFDDLADLDLFFARLQLITQTSLKRGESLIIFNEVQHCPKARQAIKHLVADGRFHYIETGSSISVSRNVRDILIPSEEQKIQMYPMDYEEFCWVLGDRATMPILQDLYDRKSALDDAVHRKLMKRYQLYLLIGGMPAAVSAYLESQNISQVDLVKREILQSYFEDLLTIDPRGDLQAIVQKIPTYLQSGSAHFPIRSTIQNRRMKSEKVQNLIAELTASGIVLRSGFDGDPGNGLSVCEDPEKCRLFLCDTGLLVTLSFWDRDFVENQIYPALLFEHPSRALNFIYENTAAQALVSEGYPLFYSIFYNDRQKRSFVTDFFKSPNGQTCPYEVKTGSYRKSRALDEFVSTYSSRIEKQLIFHTKNRSSDDDRDCIPLYMMAATLKRKVIQPALITAPKFETDPFGLAE